MSIQKTYYDRSCIIFKVKMSSAQTLVFLPPMTPGNTLGLKMQACWGTGTPNSNRPSGGRPAGHRGRRPESAASTRSRVPALRQDLGMCLRLGNKLMRRLKLPALLHCRGPKRPSLSSKPRAKGIASYLNSLVFSDKLRWYTRRGPLEMLTQRQQRPRGTPTAATWLSQSLRVNMEQHCDVQESSFHFF